METCGEGACVRGVAKPTARTCGRTERERQRRAAHGPTARASLFPSSTSSAVGVAPHSRRERERERERVKSNPAGAFVHAHVYCSLARTRPVPVPTKCRKGKKGERERKGRGRAATATAARAAAGPTRSWLPPSHLPLFRPPHLSHAHKKNAPLLSPRTHKHHTQNTPPDAPLSHAPSPPLPPSLPPFTLPPRSSCQTQTRPGPPRPGAAV